MSNLYEQMNFILSGGALKSLEEFLSPKVSAALIVAPKGAELEIVDAIGTTPEGLFMKNSPPKLNTAFPERGKGKNFEVNCASIEGEWPWAVALRGKRWTFYILLRENPEAWLAELFPIAGLVSLWQDFKNVERAEERLSRMAYMILATKNILASIFEPMPLDYFASFLADVLNESLFPRSISIFGDDGNALYPIEGYDSPPERKGIFAKAILPSAPVVIKNESAPYEIVLPIIDPPYRLFCVTKWDKAPEEEALDFLELIGNLASQALYNNSLKIENTSEKNIISSGAYTILTLSETLSALKSRKNRPDLLSMMVDIYTEITKVEECLLVAWDKELKGYMALDYRKGGIKTPHDLIVLPSGKVSSKTEKQVFNLAEQEFSELLKCPWPEMAAMKLAFPIWGNGCLEGFIAVSSEYSALKHYDKVSALIIVAQFAAYALKDFD